MIISYNKINALLLVLLARSPSSTTSSSSSSSSSITGGGAFQNPWGITIASNRRGQSIISHDALQLRGGNQQQQVDDEEEEEEEEESLEDKVKAAMLRLGLTPDGDEFSNDGDGTSEYDSEEEIDDDDNCKDGVCTVPPPPQQQPKEEEERIEPTDEEFQTIADRISDKFQNNDRGVEVDASIIIAALGASRRSNGGLDEEAAVVMIRNEMDAIARVMEDCDEVRLLVSEGHSPSLTRRALAFADMNIEVARAILQADEEDAKIEQEEAEKVAQEAEAAREVAEEEEKKRRLVEEKREAEAKMKTVAVDANFDPTDPTGSTKSKSTSSSSSPLAGLAPPKPSPQKPPNAPPPARREDVIFQATSSNIQKILYESPVPILLDVYADWCGPCKALTPALEDMAIKAGGMFRLVKLNTDEERNISSGALEVKSLPTVFGMKDGKIVHMFEGMPRSEDFMRNFMMGLFGGGEFSPRVTEEEKERYLELSKKLVKVASASGFSFSQRERLTERTTARLDALVKACGGDMKDAEESAKVVRSLLNNLVKDPFGLKFRRVNLENKVIKARIASFPPAISILKSVGFTNGDGEDDGPQNTMILGKGKKVVNMAPITVAKDAIDKWIDANRRAIATAARKKKDEIARAKLLEEAEEIFEEDEDAEEEEEEKVDPNACTLKVRIEGKNKISTVELRADDTLGSILEALPVKVADGEDVQFTCTARRLIVKSSDEKAMSKTLGEHKLTPAASVVVKIGEKKEVSSSSSSSLKERAAARKELKKGEHTMQSIGLYAKDDNAKGELIDGGGGVWFEHDVSSDDEAEEEEEKPSAVKVASVDVSADESGEESAATESEEYDEYDEE